MGGTGTAGAPTTGRSTSAICPAARACVSTTRTAASLTRWPTSEPRSQPGWPSPSSTDSFLEQPYRPLRSTERTAVTDIVTQPKDQIFTLAHISAEPGTPIVLGE